MKSTYAPQIVIGLGSVIIGCFVVALLAGYWRSNEQDVVAQRALEVDARSHLAVTRDHLFIIKMCNRFHRIETVDAYSAKGFEAIEFRYPRPNNNTIDIAYHVARRKLLAEVSALKGKDASQDCELEMESAKKRALTTQHAAP